MMNMEINRRKKLYIVGIDVLLFITILLYIIQTFTGFDSFVIPPILWVLLYCVTSISYIFLFRQKQLFCYETFFFFFFFFALFYDYIIIGLIQDQILWVHDSNPFPQSLNNKSYFVQMSGYFAFIRGGVTFMDSESPNDIMFDLSIGGVEIDYSLLSKAFSLFTLIYVAYLHFFTDVFSSWYKYSGIDSSFSLTELFILTSLLLVVSVFEFCHLYNLGCDTFLSVVRKINKLYLICYLFVLGVLLVSGNRNDALLVLMPPIIMYSFLIHHIGNRTFIIGAFLGFILMICVGFLREDRLVLSNMSFSIYDLTRDFSYIGLDNAFLIDYVDTKGTIGFNNFWINLASSIPFLGGIVVGALNLKLDIGSPELATNNMQMLNNLDSGLGTGLIGDLYYTAGFVFVLLFMFFFSKFISSVYNSMVFKYKFNIWMLIIFVFSFSNVVYSIRAPWLMPFRYIGFSFCFVVLGLLINKK